MIFSPLPLAIGIRWTALAEWGGAILKETEAELSGL